MIKQKLDEYVIGQERAKKVISVAVYNHYKRVYAEDLRSSGKNQETENEDVRIEKSNTLWQVLQEAGKPILVKNSGKASGCAPGYCRRNLSDRGGLYWR